MYDAKTYNDIIGEVYYSPMIIRWTPYTRESKIYQWVSIFIELLNYRVHSCSIIKIIWCLYFFRWKNITNRNSIILCDEYGKWADSVAATWATFCPKPDISLIVPMTEIAGTDNAGANNQTVLRKLFYERKIFTRVTLLCISPNLPCRPYCPHTYVRIKK